MRIGNKIQAVSLTHPAVAKMIRIRAIVPSSNTIKRRQKRQNQKVKEDSSTMMEGTSTDVSAPECVPPDILRAPALYLRLQVQDLADH